MSKQSKILSYLKKNKVKLIIWAVIIILAAGGFYFEGLRHSDKKINQKLEDNFDSFSVSAEILSQKDCGSAIDILIENPVYSELREPLSQLKNAGVEEIKSSNGVVEFYLLERIIIVYSPDKQPSDCEPLAFEDWFFKENI